MKQTFSYNEIISVCINHKRTIVVLALLCALMFGGYKGRGIINSNVSDEEYQSLYSTYEKERARYEEEVSYMDAIIKSIDSSITAAGKAMSENPVMQIDPFDCEYQVISVAITGNPTADEGIVSSWISDLDLEDVIGANSTISSYKSDVLFEKSDESSFSITIYACDQYDHEKITNSLAEYLRKRAEASFADNVSISVSSHKGWSEELYKRQDFVRQGFVNMQNQRNSIQEKKRTLLAPSEPERSDRSGVIISAVKFAVFGLFVGALAGIALIIYMMLYGGIMYSREQVENLFSLDCLGVYDSTDSSSARLLQANIDAFNKRSVLIVGETGFEELIQMTKELKDITIGVGKNLISDVPTIEALAGADAVVLGIILGRTSFEEIQHSIIRAQNMGKSVLGYIVL